MKSECVIFYIPVNPLYEFPPFTFSPGNLGNYESCSKNEGILQFKKSKLKTCLTVHFILFKIAFHSEYGKKYNECIKNGADVKRIPKMLLPVPLSGIAQKTLLDYDKENIEQVGEDVRTVIDRSGNERPYFYSIYKITNPVKTNQVRGGFHVISLFHIPGYSFHIKFIFIFKFKK